jgi:alcohol dehydrogenase class IV
MNTVTLLQPPHIVFGNGCAPQCVEFLAQTGVKRLLLVSGKSVRSQLDSVVAALKQSGMQVFESSFVPPEPTVKFFEAALAESRKHQPATSG